MKITKQINTFDMIIMSVFALIVIYAIVFIVSTFIPSDIGGIDRGCNMTASTLADKYIWGRC